MSFILLILEIIGTVSFAISGAIAAIRAQLDLYGVLFIGCITAIGGGIVRDVLIGQYPPAIFFHFSIFLTALLTSAFLFLIPLVSHAGFNAISGKLEKINTVFDAVGLAAFSVMGTEASFAAGFMNNPFLAVALGMLTGIGGGIFRDILTDTTPYVLKKHVYATASILGCLLYYFLRKSFADLLLPSVISMTVVILIRLFAAKYRWNLPHIAPYGTNENKRV